MPTLVVETGTGSSTANSYCTRAFADAYFLARANPDWLRKPEDARDSALIKGTQYIDDEYTWTGVKGTKAQALEWPQSGADDGEYAVDTDEIPVRVQQATAESALAELTIAGGLRVSDPTAGSIQASTVKIGGITVSDQYGSPKSSRRILPTVDRLLRPFVQARGTMERA